MRPSSYRVQNGCWNCKYHKEYAPCFYGCNAKKKYPYPEDLFSAERFKEWYDNYCVELGGICDEWKGDE